jgi:cyclopropane fatty-acyl-phospholipid synthase-like methyltransferase
MTRLVRAALKLENVFYEYRFGISTRGLYGFTPGDWSRAEHIYYGTVPFRGIFQILDSLALRQTDIVVDVGCGKGRVLCCAALYDVDQVIGVEDTKELCDVARSNLERIRQKRAPVEVIHGKAEDFDYSRGTVFYLFHPFGPNTLKSVVTLLGRELQRKLRSIRIVYVNPRHESVLEETDWLERYAHWSAGAPSSRFVTYAVSFWGLRPSSGGVVT